MSKTYDDAGGALVRRETHRELHRLRREVLRLGAEVDRLRGLQMNQSACRRLDFIEREQAHYPIVTLCRALGVSPSGYWARRVRMPSARSREDEQLLVRIRQIYAASGNIYGAARIRAALAADGIRIRRKRVARLMRLGQLRG